MSDWNPKEEERDGRIVHFSVGAIIELEGKLLLIERDTLPPGWAGVAGHVDAGEDPLPALYREVLEEVSLDIVKTTLLREEFVEWNWCDSGVTGHHWHLYHVEIAGIDHIKPQGGEVKTLAWFTREELAHLPLEEVWRYWFEETGYLSK